MFRYFRQPAISVYLAALIMACALFALAPSKGHATEILTTITEDTTLTGPEKTYTDADFTGADGNRRVYSGQHTLILDRDTTATVSGVGAGGGTFAVASVLNVVNNANLSVTGDMITTLYGITVSSDGSAINNGTIDFTSGFQGYNGAIIAYARNFTITNTGEIHTHLVNGTSGSAAAVNIFNTLGTTATINNSGLISVEGGIGTFGAIDIRSDSTVNLTNTGRILTTGSAYELRIYSDARATANFVGTYNLMLDGDPTHASIRVDRGTLNLNNATLSVDGIDGTTQWDTEYKIFETANGGTINGDYSAVTATNPNTAVFYTAGATRDDDTVRLEYAPPASSANVSAEVAELAVMNSISVVHNRMATSAMMQSLGLTTVAQADQPVMVASAGTTMTDTGERLIGSDNSPRAALFAMPYGSWSRSTNSPMGYEAVTGGLTAGYEYQMENTILGIHGGFGRAGIDFTGSGFSDNSEKQNVFTLGLHGGASIDNWVLGASITPYLSLHEYSGKTGAGLAAAEDADFTSYGMINRFQAGYRILVGDSVLMPTAGINHLWIHRDRYTTDASGAANTTYSTLDDHEFQALGGLRWMKNIEMDGYALIPSVYGGIRQTLSDGSTSTTQSVPGAQPVSVTSDSDYTAANLEAQLSYIKDDWSYQLGYAGECGETTISHGAWLRAKWSF